MDINGAIRTMDSNITRDKALAQSFRDNARNEHREMTKEEKAILSDLEARIERNKEAQEVLKDTKRDMDREDASFNDPTTPTGAKLPSNRTASVRVTSEERVYHKGNDPQATNFMLDVIRSQMFGDPSASARLDRHMSEERTLRPGLQAYRAAGDTTSANWSGLVVPAYVTDLVAPAVANMRPFADAATNKHELPPTGLSVAISRVTTSTLAGLQSAELTTLPTQSADDTLLTVPIQTAGGFANVSRQAIERGVGVDMQLMNDLFARYATDLDSQMINQAATGALAVAANTDVVTAGFTPQVLYSKIVGSASGVNTALLNVGQATHVIMHPRRWSYMSAQMVNTWPMISNQASGFAASTGRMTSNEYGAGVVGELPNGLFVVTDANIPTNLTAGAGSNEDALLVVAQNECHLWEDANQPAFIRAEQPNSPALGVLLVVYGYYGYTFARYNSAVGKLTGAALTAPTF